MAVVTRSIGTTGRDYSTIALWEADLDVGAIYAASDDAVGECYNDSVFNESVTIDGGTTIGLTSIRLSVASTDRHDGTAGTGARIERSAAHTSVIAYSQDLKKTTEWLEINGLGNTSQFGTLCYNNTSVNSTDSDKQVFRNLLLHPESSANRYTSAVYINTRPASVLNCIVYNVVSTGATGSSNQFAIGGDDRLNALNNTVYNVSYANSTGFVYGIGSNGNATSGNSANLTAKNNLVISVSGGTAQCYDASLTLATTATNGSSDATGTAGLHNLTTAEFVSTVGGSEDLHLVSSATSIDAGTDLGVTPSGVEIDINGRDRDAEADTWDIGAHEFVAAGGGVTVTPDNLASSTTLTEPTLTQHNIMSVDSITLSTTLTESSFTQNYQFSVNYLAVSSALTEPVLTQNYQLPADNLSMSTALTSPTLIQQNILLVDNLALSTVLSGSSFTQQNILSSDNLSVSTTLTESALAIAGALAVQNLAVGTQVTEAGLTQHNILVVDNIALNTTLTESSLAGTTLLSVNDLAVGTSISQPTLDIAFSLLVDNLTIVTDLTQSTFTQHNVLFVDDMSINSLLSVVNLGGAVISCLSGYITITPKYTANTETSPRLGGNINIE